VGRIGGSRPMTLEQLESIEDATLPMGMRADVHDRRFTWEIVLDLDVTRGWHSQEFKSGAVRVVGHKGDVYDERNFTYTADQDDLYMGQLSGGLEDIQKDTGPQDTRDCACSSTGCGVVPSAKNLFAVPQKPSECACLWDRGLGKQRLPPYNDKGQLHWQMLVSRAFVFECTTACGCGRLCPFKVTQRPSEAHVMVFRHHDHASLGWGVRAAEKLLIGQFVCRYVGELYVAKEHSDALVRRGRTVGDYAMTLDLHPEREVRVTDDNALTLDAEVRGNIGRFINHSCSPNLTIKRVVQRRKWGNTATEVRFHAPCLFALREIRVGEELTWDYGVNKPRPCFCSSCAARPRPS